MFNFIKYLPLRWRVRDDYCIPKGPSFKHAEKLDIPIAGSRLRLSAPDHSPPRRRMRDHRIWRNGDVLDQKLGRYGTGVLANDHWGCRSALRRIWTFWGPWMTGDKADISISISVIGRHEEFALPNVSFFNPQVFEIVLVQYFNDLYGHCQWDNGAPCWQGPIDWQTHQQLPVFSASCKIYMSDWEGNKGEAAEHLFLFPITDQHFVKIQFQQSLSRDEHGNITFDTTPVQALQDAVQNSVRLELSPEAQAAWDKAKAESGGQTLTESFPLLRWPCHPNLEPNTGPELLSGNIHKLDALKPG